MVRLSDIDERHNDLEVVGLSPRGFIQYLDLDTGERFDLGATLGDVSADFFFPHERTRLGLDT